MSRTTDIINISLPPEINNQINAYLEKNHLTRSEFIRSLINDYFGHKEYKHDANVPSEPDLANILKYYWDLRSKSDLKIVPITLGIIVNESGKVLIGARKGRDEWVENLTWVFPGGKIESLDFESETIREIKGETGIDVKVNELIAARIHPDSGLKKVQIVALYFYCTPLTESTRAVDGLSELKWVEPLDVYKYFTTSTCDEVSRFLNILAKSHK
jgi:8-oxo-dGTP pyrophosphatase MutT (NUDIX family)